MKLTTFLILISVISVFANKTYSQTKALNLSMKNSTVKEVLRNIEEQSEFYFMYSEKLVDVNRKVSINIKNTKVDEVLDQLFASTDVEHTVKDRFILLTTPEVLGSDLTALQQKSITGTVTDEGGELLPGVTVVIKGTTKGTVTDVYGKYTITNLPEGATLQFSFVGMVAQEILVADQTNISITMRADAIGLEEVIAIGYGTQKKVNLTGAVSVATKEEFENKSVPNAVAAIVGKIPGVTITKTSGKPGAENFQLQVRGASSINNVGALVLIDGVQGSLLGINPNDIESMTVLKDAAAASIYGSNAAGGVILVTTKKGKAGKVTVTYDGMYGITKIGRLPHQASVLDQKLAMTTARRNQGNPYLEWEDPVRLAWFSGERLDEADAMGITVQTYPTGRFYVRAPNVWYSASEEDKVKAYTKDNNPVQTHNISVSGGSDKNRFFLSAGYYKRQGIMRYGDDSNERLNLRVNGTNKLSKHFTLNSSVAFSNNTISQNSVSSETVLHEALRLWSESVTYGPTGDYFAMAAQWPSWVQLMKEGGVNTTDNYNFDGKVDLQIKDLLPGLEVNLVGASNNSVSKGFRTSRTLVYYGPEGRPNKWVNRPNSMVKNQSLTNFKSFQGFASYVLSLKESHNFKLLGGYSYEDYKSDFIQGVGRNLVTNDLFSFNYADPTLASNSDNISTWATMATFGRFNYNFKEKYLFEANVRYDGSSRLAPENRWHAFPSLSAGWNIDKEEFFQNVGFIQNLKLRASWGQLGNSNALGLYDYIPLLYTGDNLPFNDARAQYVYQNQLASQTKTWETIETSNIGLDLMAFDRRLAFTFDAYIKQNKDMLIGVQVPATIGVGTPAYNAGELETKGWETAISWREMSKKFKYSLTFTLSDNTNKLVSYEGRSIISEGRNSLVEGLALNTMWGYKTDGFFQSDQEYQDYGVYIDPKTGGGDMKYLDLNNDKRINVGDGTLEDHGDLVQLGDTNPRYLFGINLEADWKGIDFSCFFQGVGKRSFLMGGRQMMSFRNAIHMPVQEQLDYWTPENTDAFFPRPYNGGSQSYWSSDYWVQDAAYIRMKNITIGYTIPTALSQKAGISKARFFVSGQDLFEFTKTLSWIDPETADGSQTVYPFYRTISMGCNITF